MLRKHIENVFRKNSKNGGRDWHRHESLALEDENEPIIKRGDGRTGTLGVSRNQVRMSLEQYAQEEIAGTEENPQ